MDSKSCAHKLNDILSTVLSLSLKLSMPMIFLTSKTESELFELYNKMFDPDVHHYMTGTKGGFVIPEIHL